jgi:hypothetical protein
MTLRGGTVRTSLALLGLLGCSSSHGGAVPSADAAASADASAADAPDGPPAPPPPKTFKDASDAALGTLQTVLFHDGNWNVCAPGACSVLLPFTDFDWGADTLTAALYFRWTLAKDASIPPMMTALDANGPSYGSCTAQSCVTWSDVPLWDSVAASQEYLVTQAPSALKRAEEAFAYVDTATEFAVGACPSVDYQEPRGGGDLVKTLESDANYVRAALYLFQLTGTQSYLDKAVAKYAVVRQSFLDPAVPLYTVYVFDDGQACTPLSRRFYASVNGIMISNGLALAAATGTATYGADAVATAQAVAQNLSDAAGVYANLQTDDDVAEPLVEAMYELATVQSQAFAQEWLITNARAMAGARTAGGLYGRFFDGPPPQGNVTIWETAGALALAFAAGALSPDADASGNADAWKGATYVAQDLATLPSSIAITGQAVAVFGTLGEADHHLGQAQVFVDDVQTFDQTGVHQAEDNAFGPVPGAVLFAWRWPASGSHTLRFQAGPADAKNGGPFLHVVGYEYVP